jgi:hypothetical protein
MSIWPSVRMHGMDLYADTTLINLSACSEPFHLRCQFHFLSVIHHTPSDVTTVQTWATFSLFRHVACLPLCSSFNDSWPFLHQQYQSYTTDFEELHLCTSWWHTQFSTADLTCLQKNWTFANYWNKQYDKLHVWQQQTNMSHSLSTCYTERAAYPCKLHPHHFNRKFNYLNLKECRKLLDSPLYVSHYCYCKAHCWDILPQDRHKTTTP